MHDAGDRERAELAIYRAFVRYGLSRSERIWVLSDVLHAELAALRRELDAPEPPPESRDPGRKIAEGGRKP